MNTNQAVSEDQIKNIVKAFFQANSYPIGCLVELAGSTRPRIVSKVINKMNTTVNNAGEQYFEYELDNGLGHWRHDSLKFIDVPCKQYCSRLFDEEFDTYE